MLISQRICSGAIEHCGSGRRNADALSYLASDRILHVEDPVLIALERFGPDFEARILDECGRDVDTAPVARQVAH